VLLRVGGNIHLSVDEPKCGMYKSKATVACNHRRANAQVRPHYAGHHVIIYACHRQPKNFLNFVQNGGTRALFTKKVALFVGSRA
jgi:hypothetical protein